MCRVAQEAQSFFELIRHGESAESIREQIGKHSRERRAVRFHFDVLADPETRIPQLLHRGWTQKQIRAKFGISLERIRRACGTSAEFLHGRGRRFSPQLKNQIAAMIQTGKRPAEIARVLDISLGAALKARRAAGFRDRRIYTQRVTDEQLEAVVQHLKNGVFWRAAARNVGIGVQTAMRRLSYRKGRQTKRPSDEKLALATERVKNGESWSDVARDFGVCGSTLRKFISWRRVVKKRWSRARIAFVKAALLEGRRACEIARTHNLSMSYIYRLRDGDAEE